MINQQTTDNLGGWAERSLTHVVKISELKEEKKGVEGPDAAQTECPSAQPPKPLAAAQDVEGLPEFPDSLGEPFAAVQPGGLVHAHRAWALRNPAPRRRAVRPPSPFKLSDGSEVSFLPGHDSRTSPVSIEQLRSIAIAHPEYRISEAMRAADDQADDQAEGAFLGQVERARDYLRGPRFWRLKRGEYSGYWLKHRAEELSGGTYRGYIGELALVVAALLDGLSHNPSPNGEHATIFR